MKLKKTKIWAVTEGPTDAHGGDYHYEIPNECNYVILCKVEENRKLVDKEFWFETKREAYNFKNYIDSSDSLFATNNWIKINWGSSTVIYLL